MNPQEAYYWEQRETREEIEINKTFLFPAAYRALQEAKRCKN